MPSPSSPSIRPLPSRRLRTRTSAGLAALLLAACSTSPVEAPETPAAPLPLLAPGFTLGTTLYGSADLPAAGPERTRLEEARAAGLSGFAVYVDWADLEPEPGRYTLDGFVTTLAALQAWDLTPFVNITVGDSGEYNLPPGLGDGAGGIAPGVSLDDPDVLDRFGALVERVAPLVAARGGFFLGVGNEVDEYLDPDERAREAYVRFTEHARDRVLAVEPQMAVGVTLTGRAVRERSPTFRALRAVSDVVPFNHAPIRPDFFVRPLDRVRDDFREVLEAYGDGPVVIQELTCPSAPSMDASEAWQLGCFQRLFAEIEARPEIRFASVFTFQDFEGATCDLVREALFGDELDDLPEDVARRLADYLCTLGVVRPDGSPKPAWEAVLEAAGGGGP